MFNSQYASAICWLSLQTVWIQIRSDKMSDLIWHQTVWQSDGISERSFRKKLIWKIFASKQNNILKLPNMHRCKWLTLRNDSSHAKNMLYRRYYSSFCFSLYAFFKNSRLIFDFYAYFNVLKMNSIWVTLYILVKNYNEPATRMN